MPQELQLPDGRILVIPDNITLDQRASLRNKLGAQYADVKTGVGMEQRATQQAKQALTGTGQQGNYDAQGRKISGPKGEPLSPMERAAQEQSDRQTTLGSRMNRASQSPMPFTTAVSAYAPMTAAKAIAGGKVGGRAGGAIAKQISNSPDAEGYGELAGGLVGSTAATLRPGKLIQRITRGPGATGEATINPGTIAARELEARVPRNEPPGARQQMQTQIGQQSADAIKRAEAATPKPPMSRIPTRMPVKPSPAPLGATMSSAPGGTTTATLPAAPGGPQAPVTLGQRMTPPLSFRPAVPDVSRVPVPRSPMPGDPNLMGSVPREELPSMASRAVPGAADQQRLLGKPIVYTPPEGFPPPKSVTKFGDIGGELTDMQPEPEQEMDIRRGNAGPANTLSDSIAQRQQEAAQTAEANRQAWEQSQTRGRQRSARDRAAAIRAARQGASPQ